MQPRPSAETCGPLRPSSRFRMSRLPRSVQLGVADRHRFSAKTSPLFTSSKNPSTAAGLLMFLLPIQDASAEVLETLADTLAE